MKREGIGGERSVPHFLRYLSVHEQQAQIWLLIMDIPTAAVAHEFFLSISVI